MDFDLSKAGEFRANPHANGKNNIRIRATEPGTPQEDTGTVDVTSGTAFTGIEYTGADGVAKFSRFYNEEDPTAKALVYDVQVAEGRDKLRDAILYAVSKHEVGAIVEVAGTGNSYTIKHVGSGTLGKVYLDGAANNLTRGAITGLSIEVEATTAEATEGEVEEVVTAGKGETTTAAKAKANAKK